jgi:hypothetical protein
MILTWVSVLFLLYKSFLWWETHKKPVQAIIPSVEVSARRPAPVVAKPIYQPPKPLPIQHGASTSPATSHVGNRTVTKCMVNGQVIFTDRDCPSGAKESSVTVNTANLGTVAPRVQETAPVPGQQRNVVTTTTTYTTNGAAANASGRAAECTYMDFRIKQIDSQARQPLSGQAQDGLSAEKARLRSKQYELHC